MSCAKRSRLAQVFNDLHGLLVLVGKQYWLQLEASCAGCPLRCFLALKRGRLKRSARAFA